MLLNEFGPPENFALADLPTPEPGPGELLIRVEASSVNPVDTKIRSGALSAICSPLPAVLHGDVCGRIERLGAGLENGSWETGQRIWACAGGVKGTDGALAEFMRVDARLCALAPQELHSTEAAALPLVGITAWQAVIDRANVRPGENILVHGGSGGVGHICVQLAKLCGAHVTATVSTENKMGLARDLGADAVHQGRDAPENRFDAVIDTIGGDNVGRSMEQIVTGGRVVTIAARTMADLSPMHAKAAALHVVFMLLPLLTGQGREAHGMILERLRRLVDQGEVRPLIAAGYPFVQVAQAHQALEEGKHAGKITLAGW